MLKCGALYSNKYSKRNGTAHLYASVVMLAGGSLPQIMERIARFGDAARVPMDRQTWYELYELANGHEVP